ncbi:MAG: hypothetical protein IPP19_10810 [Verrucomicrobia bacterium]|nr:hypothetical protein [Verrucomicrobiota bacterium]
MRKLLNNPWFVTAMALLAVALMWSSLRTSDGNSSISAAGDPAETAVDPNTSEQPLPSGEMPTASSQDALKKLIIPKQSRDPFASRNVQPAATVETVEQPDLLDSVHLTGIWSQNGATLLLLNNRVTQVGDTIGRITIESADPDGVWLTHWKGRDFLTVGKIFVLRTPVRRASTP